MINTEKFFLKLKENNIEFFTGVPDSLLKEICSYISDNTDDSNHIIAANEGNAIALAAGYHMASRKIPMVYMQNSGFGNAINPLMSLTSEAVYRIPMLLMIGWRGEPNIKDEPQHIAQGAQTIAFLEAAQIPYVVLSPDENEAILQLNMAVLQISQSSSPFAIVVRKDTFEKYSMNSKIETEYKLSREDVIKAIVDKQNGSEVIVSTTGKTSRELFEYRDKIDQNHDRDFLTVGSMGHASQIALGVAITKPNTEVVCIDGDGALLMHMGSMAIIGKANPSNLIHIIINNGAHESVGGQATVGFDIDIPKLAKANNYKYAITVSDIESFNKAFEEVRESDGPSLIEVRVKIGSRKNLGRPSIPPLSNKRKFMSFLKDN
ncbi:MAG: phosphonopyruvate decarboxylase [Bacteroidetes bacterium]|nr:MAG: phosphonopyruvate decarboxylase [Bacteroidota bacterium]